MALWPRICCFCCKVRSRQLQWGPQAANPIRVRAVAADGVTPVSGATIAWASTASNGLQFSVCSAASSCSVLSDEAGESSSWVTPTATGPSTITIALAPASYSPPQSQQATVVGTSSALDLVAVAPTRWVGQGATLAVPLMVEALDLGVPQGECGDQFCTHEGHSFAFGEQRDHQRLGIRHDQCTSSRIKMPMCR